MKYMYIKKEAKIYKSVCQKSTAFDNCERQFKIPKEN
jgi:hypothetical protein